MRRQIPMVREGKWETLAIDDGQVTLAARVVTDTEANVKYAQLRGLATDGVTEIYPDEMVALIRWWRQHFPEYAAQVLNA